MREFIFRLVRKSNDNDRFVKIYDYYIIIVAIISITPLLFRTPSPIFKHIETVTVYLLFLDYILRWITHDYHVNKHSPWAFVMYPFTPLAIMDILGILPTIGLLPSSFMILRLLRLVKIVQYSKSCSHIAKVFKNQQKMLLSVFTIAITYIFVSALIMFLHEPADIFGDFFDALYWATTALTTVGYGDIYPATDIGKFISMISSFFGVAIIAMPASIVTAGFMEALSEDNKKKEEE
ncbi:MAG: ion channel [Coprobacillus sp.]